jgi:hypothetical protein
MSQYNLYKIHLIKKIPAKDSKGINTEWLLNSVIIQIINPNFSEKNSNFKKIFIIRAKFNRKYGRFKTRKYMKNRDDQRS